MVGVGWRMETTHVEIPKWHKRSSRLYQVQRFDFGCKNQDEIDRVRKITKEDIIALNGKHPNNPNIKLEVTRDDEFEIVMITDMVKRIIDSDINDKQVVMIMSNPDPMYRKVAYMLNEMNVSCRNGRVG